MTHRYLTMEESVREALSRKRRLRLIYKWRHKLARTHQPAHRDRSKLARLAAWQEMQPWRAVPGPIGRLLEDRVTNAMKQIETDVASVLFG